MCGLVSTGRSCRRGRWTVQTGRSSAWLERLLWEQEVARSNRVAPILKTRCLASVYQHATLGRASLTRNGPDDEKDHDYDPG